MPQMAPISWTILTFWFWMIFSLFYILVFYLYSPNPPSSFNLEKPVHSMNWKW